MIINERIDGGKAFDWGRTSSDYAKYRDIYPKEFYETAHNFGLAQKGQKVLDLGTGTGVIPRNMYSYGATFIGTDISENQIVQAKELSKSQNLNIEFFVSSAENINYPEKTFDSIIACQCFTYFNHDVVAPKMSTLLKHGGRMAFMYMAWLVGEDEIARASEELILKFNPSWTDCNDVRHEINVPEVYYDYFEKENSVVFDAQIPFTRESWNGRMKACRAIGASLSEEEIQKFESEHIKMLSEITPEKFNILHYCAITVLKKK